MTSSIGILLLRTARSVPKVRKPENKICGVNFVVMETVKFSSQYYLSKEMWSMQVKEKLFDLGRIQTHYPRILITD